MRGEASHLTLSSSSTSLLGTLRQIEYFGNWDLTKENPFENTVNARILPKVRMSAPPLEANTCRCDWLLPQDPGAASILVLLCIIETQNTFSQKDSFANHVR